MKMLVIAGFAGSLLNFRGHLLAAMVARDIEVHVAAPGLSEGSTLRLQLEERRLKVHNITLRRTGTNPLVEILALWSLLRVLSRIKPDAVLGYTIKPVIYGTLAAWLVRVPRRYVLITGLGYAFNESVTRSSGRVRAVAANLYKHSLRLAHKVFFQNIDDQELFFELGLLPAYVPSVVLNGSGVDLTQYRVVPHPSAPPHFLLIARLLGAKGLREYAKAAQHLKALHPQVQFSLVGCFDENPDSISQAELDTWIQTGALNYLGFLDDVRPAIAQCNVYVLPSYREGTPRTVLEAMAMGRAVITTDAPGCRETVVDGQTGFLVSVKSVDGLVVAMERFIQQPHLAPLFGQRARALAEDKYDVHRVNAKMLSEMSL